MSQREIDELAGLPPMALVGLHTVLGGLGELAGRLRAYAVSLDADGAPTIADGMRELADDLEQRRYRSLEALGRSAVSRRSDASASAE